MTSCRTISSGGVSRRVPAGAHVARHERRKGGHRTLCARVENVRPAWRAPWDRRASKRLPARRLAPMARTCRQRRGVDDRAFMGRISPRFSRARAVHRQPPSRGRDSFAIPVHQAAKWRAKLRGFAHLLHARSAELARRTLLSRCAKSQRFGGASGGVSANVNGHFALWNETPNGLVVAFDWSAGALRASPR